MRGNILRTDQIGGQCFEYYVIILCTELLECNFIYVKEMQQTIWWLSGIKTLLYVIPWMQWKKGGIHHIMNTLLYSAASVWRSRLPGISIAPVSHADCGFHESHVYCFFLLLLIFLHSCGCGQNVDVTHF
jgi:hypothetical protein